MDRTCFLDVFLDHGISPTEIHSMSDIEFTATLNGYLDETDPSSQSPAHEFEDSLLQEAIALSLMESHSQRLLAADAILRPCVGRRRTFDHFEAIPSVRHKPATLATFSEDYATERQIQDSEYEEVIEEARRAEREKRRAEQERKRKGRMLAESFRGLPPEPKEGVVIAVAMPNGGRIQRKFEPNTKAELVYVWVAGTSVGWEKSLVLGEFELEVPIGMKRIEKEKSLGEQGISGRVLLSVSPI
jgi:hypothetical protein